MSPLAVVLIVSGLAVAAVITIAIWLMDRDDRDDPFAQSGLVVDAATVMDMTMPPEIAHDDPFTPLTSPAAPPRPFAGDAGPPGTTAAAAGEGPPASPSPLPQVIARYPEHFPFTAWLDDKVAEAGHAIQGSTP